MAPFSTQSGSGGWRPKRWDSAPTSATKVSAAKISMRSGTSQTSISWKSA